MRSRLTILLLAVFVAIDVVLVTLAFRHTATAPSVVPRSGASQPSAAATSPVGEVSPSQSASTGQSDESSRDDPPVRFLAVGADGVVLRASRGDCAAQGDVVVTVSTNAGRRFRDSQVDGLDQVVRADVRDDGSLLLIGAGEDCSIARWTSADDGRSWSQAAGSGDEWHLLPDPELEAVHAPGGRRDTPCVPADLSVVDPGVARLSCDDGQILGTSDGGVSWVPLGRLDGTVSTQFRTPGDGFALAADDDCRAAVFVTTDGGSSWTRRACLDGRRPLAVAYDGDVVAAQVGQDTRISTDTGSSWTDPSGN